MPSPYSNDVEYTGICVFNNNILLVSMANNQITITAVTVIEPIAVDLNLQLRSITIIHKSIILLKIKRVYWYFVCITKCSCSYRY